MKLARLRRDASLGTLISNLESDPQEDVYIRLEAVAYLVAVHSVEAAGLFAPCLASPDPQIQLEAVIALAEAGTDECVRMLGAIPDIGSTSRLLTRLSSSTTFGRSETSTRPGIRPGPASPGALRRLHWRPALRECRFGRLPFDRSARSRR